MKSIKDEFKEAINDIKVATGSLAVAVTAVVFMTAIFVMYCGLLVNSVLTLLTLGEFALSIKHTSFCATAFAAVHLFFESLPSLDDDPKGGKREKAK